MKKVMIVFSLISCVFLSSCKLLDDLAEYNKNERIEEENKEAKKYGANKVITDPKTGEKKYVRDIE